MAEILPELYRYALPAVLSAAAIYLLYKIRPRPSGRGRRLTAADIHRAHDPDHSLSKLHRSMSELTRRINHPHLGEIIIYGTRDEEGNRTVLDVEQGREALPRERWMSAYHDDLAGRLPRYCIGETVVIRDTYPNRRHVTHEAQAMVTQVEGQFDDPADVSPQYRVRGIEEPVPEKHLRPPTDEELEHHDFQIGGPCDPRNEPTLVAQY